MDKDRAFNKMFNFLRECYLEKYNDDLGSLLGDLRINPNENRSMDEAVYDDWFKIFNANNQKKEVDDFDVMIKFLEEESSQGLNTLDSLIEDFKNNPEFRRKWDRLPN